MNKLILGFVLCIWMISLGSATISYYDPTSNVTTNWNDGTAQGFEEIDDGTRQPNAPVTSTSVADNTQSAAGISEFGFSTPTGVPNNMTLWLYTTTGSSCSYSFLLQQAGATRCSATVSSGTAASWQSCTWASPSGDYSAMTVELSTVSKGAGGHTDCTVYEAYLEVDAVTNDPPLLSNITAIPSPIKGGNTITVYANHTDHGLNDTDGDSLNFYCDTTSTPTAANTDCTGGTTSDSTDPYAMTCTFTTPSSSSNNTIYCRAYDGADYSNVSNYTYEADATPPTIAISSVAGDLTASYFDSANDGVTEINITGESNMLCRWGTSDVTYDLMSNSCTVSGTDADCDVTGISSEGFYTRYVSCQDSLENNQNTTQNLDVSFFLDYTAPTTSDNSVSGIQSPNYTVTITEIDNVDSDPSTLYCIDTSNSCNPSSSIDDGGTITFTSSNRGVNYLRYNSTDDAGNQQTTVSKTININRLPTFSSASDDATTIGGGDTINITTVSYDTDSDPIGQDITLWVCNSTSISSFGCGDGHYCNVTGDGNQSSAGNLTCVFSAESDSATHNWHSFLYDQSGEIAINNYSGSYTTDSANPSVTVASPLNGSTITQSSVTFTIVVNEGLSWAAYSINDGANISMTNTSVNLWTRSNNSIADGTYNLTFYANDSYNNLATAAGYSFTISTSGGDTSDPVLTIQSPADGANFTTGSILLNITSDEVLTWAGYTNNSGELIDLDNVSTTSWNASVTFTEGQHNISFYGNDSAGNQGNVNSTINIDLTNPSVETLSCDPSSPSDGQNVNCSVRVYDALGLDYVIIGHNATGSFQNSSQLSLSGSNASTSYLINSGNTTPGEFSVEAYAYDLSERSNTTEGIVLTVTDDTVPEIYNITYLPNTTDLLDPGTEISVNATIVEDYNISEVVLMYQNLSDGVWTSVTMANASTEVDGGSSNVIYYASFTPQNGTWAFRINATDFAGNQNVSGNTTVDVIDDITFINSTSIPAVKSFTFAQRSDNNTLGRLFLNNTGDVGLNFSVNITSAISSRFDINYTSDDNATFEVFEDGAAVNLTLLVNTTSLSAALYDYNITISSDAGTETLVKQLNVQTAAGPYLVVSIDTFSSTVTQGDAGVTYSASVENQGTQDATGVYLNWTLPDDFSIASGSQNRSLGVIQIGGSGTNTITIDVASDADIDAVDITATGTGISAAQANATKSVNVSASVSTSTSTSSAGTGGGGGGGGGGSGGGGGGTSVSTARVIELVRGQGGFSFEIPVEGRYPNTFLKDLILELDSEFSDQFIEVEPSVIDRVDYQEIQNFVVTIDAPSYLSYEEHEIVAVISGVLVGDGFESTYTESQDILLIVQEIALSPTEDILEEARRAIQEMKNNGFNIEEVSQLILEAEQKLEERNNGEAYRLAQEIIDIKDNAFEIDNLIRRIAEVLINPKKIRLLLGDSVREFDSSYKEVPLRDLVDTDFRKVSQEEIESHKGFITGNVVKPFEEGEIGELLRLSVVAFEDGRYELADERANDALTILLFEAKGNLFLFFYLYWHFVLIGAAGLSVLTVIGKRVVDKKLTTSKIEDYNNEEINIEKLIVKNQQDYYSGRIGFDSYRNLVEEHEKRKKEIKKERTRLRNRRIRLLRKEDLERGLNEEMTQIENEIKKIQKEFYVKNKMPEKSYKFLFSSLNERIAEIEGERTTLHLRIKSKEKKVKPAKEPKHPIAKRNGGKRK